MIQAEKRNSTAGASSSTRQSANKDRRASTGNSEKTSGEIIMPLEKVFRFNRDLSHALTLLSEVGDRADCIVETLGALQSAVDIGELKMILRGFEYQMMDIRGLAKSAERIGVEA